MGVTTTSMTWSSLQRRGLAGFGRQLLLYAEAYAAEAGSCGLRLCTGVANEAGFRFYEREGWELRAVVFKKGFASLSSSDGGLAR
jgi:GNAT superfamily N-acetyltransferase